MKKVLMSFIAGYLLLINSAFAGEDAELLANYLEGIGNTQASFEQFTYDAGGRLLQSQAGELFIKHPNKFRWQGKTPFEQLLISDGHVLWQYDQDLEQATKQPLDKRLSSTPALLLSGEFNRLSDEYEIYAEPMQDEHHFVLIPKRPDALFDRLRLEFTPGKQLSRMIIKDEVGQKTVIRLFDVSHAKLDDNLFIFVAPEGTDIIESQ